MTTSTRVTELLAAIDQLCNRLHELDNSKSEIIQSLVEEGIGPARALADFQANISRILTSIDDCVREIRRQIE